MVANGIMENDSQIQNEEHDHVNTAKRTNIIQSVLPTGASTSAKQLPDNHNVNVSNIASTPLITGFATSLKQSDGTQKTQIVDSDNINYDIQNPLPTDSDSVYVKDIDNAHVTSVGWTGDVLSLFECPHDSVGVYNDSVTTPKVIYIPFCRTLYLNAVGLGCNISAKYFSNVKIEFIGSDGTVRSTYNDSSNNTKYGTRLYSFIPTACVGLKFYFVTANTDVGLTNITIQKETAVTARLRALKPDGTVTDIDATTGGNLKVSLEELESGISVNSNSQLRTTSFNSTGTETDFASSANQTNGNQKVKIYDNYGWTAECTPMDELRVVNPVRLIGTTFIGTVLDNNFATGIITNGGTVTQGGCQLTLSTNTTANGSAVVQSVRTARYVGGSSNRIRAVIRLPDTGTVNNVRKWGCFSSTDGAYFKISGTTLSVCTLKTSNETSVASASWNGTSFTLDTNVHTYEIYYTNSKVYFVIDGILRHTVSALTTTWSDTTNLPLRMENVNSNDSVTNVTIEVRVASIYRLGNIETQPTSYYYPIGQTAGTQLKIGAGNIHSLVILNAVNGAVITLVDSVSATTPVIIATGALTAKTDPVEIDMHSVPFFNGLRLIVSSANASCWIAYE
jgi:hypothetical protein